MTCGRPKQLAITQAADQVTPRAAENRPAGRSCRHNARMSALRPYLLAGRPAGGTNPLLVLNKFTAAPVDRVALADSAAIDAALTAAHAARGEARKLPAHERERVLNAIAAGLVERRGDFVETLVAEAGKPRKYAEVEVARAIDTFRESARLAAAQRGEFTALDQTPRGAGHLGFWRREPLGVVAAITPFNFPLNLVAHKIGPAIAAGCPFVLKPASATPVSALKLGELIFAAGWPAAAGSVLPARAADAQRLAEDPRVAVLSFTGSAEVGWALKRRADRQRVVLELGGNAAVIVCADADQPDAARRIADGAFAQAGQSCVSVQRIYVAAGAYAEFRKLLLDATAALVVGDPSRGDTDVGPLIAAAEADRLEAWVAEAVAGGARLLCGGRREGALHQPTLIENARPADRVCREEVFGPLAVLEPFDDFETVLARVNDSVFGLQAGIFTTDLRRAWRAYDALEVGGVLVNQPPTFRAENMPYGGMKASGCGREGVRFAIDDYTEWKTLVIRT